MAGAEVIRNPVNKGKETSLKNAIMDTFDSDTIVIMNLGVCHDPRLIPRMIAPIRDGNCEFSVGVCFSKLQRGSENIHLLNNISKESKPIGYLAFPRNCFSQIDCSCISLFSSK
jgi:hypothetical protein